jgi:hypothetical protein
VVNLSDRLPADAVIEDSMAVSPASPALEHSIVGDFAPVLKARSGPLSPPDEPVES